MILPEKYADPLCDIQIAAFSAYPEKYWPAVDRSLFVERCKTWNGICFGAFKKSKDEPIAEELYGYSYLYVKENCIHFFVQKMIPCYERDGLNAALVDGILNYFNADLASGKYICDGESSINNETVFQDYLEKYFGFRKAYCSLNIAYNPKICWMIPVLYSVGKFLKKAAGIGIVHLVNSVLTMEEIVRKN